MFMIEIVGKYNTAYCYTDIIDPSAYSQILLTCNYEEFKNSKIRIMPDVHAGKGCTIGTTMTITDKVVPNMVGVDIGCGMYTVNLGKVDIDLKEFDEIAHTIPTGRDVWEGRVEKFDLTELKCYRNLKDSGRLMRSLGTLGGGNHFIEIDESDDGEKYLIIHSGSRNLGTQVARHYQKIAVDLNKGMEEFFKKKEEIITTYKAQKRKREIEPALKKLEQEWRRKPLSMPEDLCYLYGEYMEDYLHDINICQQFATRNREKMAEILLEKAGLTAKSAFHTIHNYIDVKEMILRKGSVSAKDGELLLIPINMRDGSLICRGKGNVEWNFSAPHGAGRLVSRSTAKEQLTMAEYEKQMQGIYTTCVNTSTLDESPMAYKNMEDIVSNIGPTAEIISHIKPIYNFKAAEG
ncbi:MAG: RtcB family protein [Ruminococcaceae bacterium]|nr:RtcB family protein [Oscillospiraceae bacterium]